MGRILIADDHDSLRRGLAQALSEAAHDGRIDVSSAPGLGTRFTVTLPVLADSDAPFSKSIWRAGR